MMLRMLPLVLTLAAAFGGASARAESSQEPDQMADLSLEQLSDIVVTSVSRQDSRLSAAPASLYIISASDIRRSGVRTLPEALRLAPNLQVARINAHNYAISARGFNNSIANKLLVLIDGRSIYTPLYSGVFWDAQDLVMADIARIEVISGPGATIWGVNAVNGVINVITKSAADTQGGMVSASFGEHEDRGVARYGGKLGQAGHYRLYAQHIDADHPVNQAGNPVRTGFHRNQAGFRADLPLGDANATISGDVYQGKLAQLGTRDIDIFGANLIGSYTRKLSANAGLRLQFILDHTQRDQPNFFSEHLNTLEVEAQYDLRIGRHNLAMGGGQRRSWDRIVNGQAFAFLPPSKNLSWTNVFAQDEIALTDRLRATVGLKLENNHYTGNEWLPNLRLAWTPGSHHLFWSSLSRTVRAPSRIDRDFYAPATPRVVNGVPRFSVGGGPGFDSETARVAELGYRGQPAPTLSWSATAWFSDYDRLRTFESHPGSASLFENKGEGRTKGAEMWARWQVRPAWRLDGGAVIQRVHTSLKPGSRDTSGTSGLANNDPRQRYLLRSSHDLSPTSLLELTLRHVGKLPRPVVPSYRELDLHWIWTPRADFDFTITGQNLLHRRHPEFGFAPGRAVFERSVVVSIAHRF